MCSTPDARPQCEKARRARRCCSVYWAVEASDSRIRAQSSRAARTGPNAFDSASTPGDVRLRDPSAVPYPATAAGLKSARPQSAAPGAEWRGPAIAVRSSSAFPLRIRLRTRYVRRAFGGRHTGGCGRDRDRVACGMLSQASRSKNCEDLDERALSKTFRAPFPSMRGDSNVVLSVSLSATRPGATVALRLIHW